ncbi:hypothetical protein Lal_00044711 [Lupinus albus]|nr:hypothetical protein Lal_00044711 [Lupinus albus]
MAFLTHVRQLSLRRESSSIAQDFTFPGCYKYWLLLLLVGIRKDPKVGGGSKGTCKVTQDRTQHSPSVDLSKYQGEDDPKAFALVLEVFEEGEDDPKAFALVLGVFEFNAKLICCFPIGEENDYLSSDSVDMSDVNDI